jgi:hypothetical protein
MQTSDFFCSERISIAVKRQPHSLVALARALFASKIKKNLVFGSHLTTLVGEAHDHTNFGGGMVT